MQRKPHSMNCLQPAVVAKKCPIPNHCESIYIAPSLSTPNHSDWYEYITWHDVNAFPPLIYTPSYDGYVRVHVKLLWWPTNSCVLCIVCLCLQKTLEMYRLDWSPQTPKPYHSNQALGRDMKQMILKGFRSVCYLDWHKGRLSRIVSKGWYGPACLNPLCT